MRHFLTALAVAALPALAQAQDLTMYETDQSFDDVVFGLENAILGEGLVIDHTSHVGDMLERTRADVGSDVVLYQAADVFSFCSATVSRSVMEANPLNIVYCPYDIFVMQMPGSDTVQVGFRNYPDDAMQEVQTLLDDIARAAIGLD